MNKVIINLLFLWPILFSQSLLLPIQTPDRTDISLIHLTKIGQFGIVRKARPGIPSHLHTGIDIRRPGDNYRDEPVYPIAEGIVLSMRNDGPYANLIIEHHIGNEYFWTLYEHIAGIRVQPGERVEPNKAIARFMDRTELNRYGWQFDHFHFEILKQPPVNIQHDPKHPDLYFRAYTLSCFNKKNLNERYYDPIQYFSNFVHEIYSR